MLNKSIVISMLIPLCTLACQKAQSGGKLSTDHTLTKDLIAYSIQTEAADTSLKKVLKPSQIFASLATNEDLRKQYIGKMLSNFEKSYITSTLVAALKETFAIDVDELLSEEINGSLSSKQMDSLVEATIAAIEKNADTLDRFPTLPLSFLNTAHKLLLEQKENEQNIISDKGTYLPTGEIIHEYTLKLRGSEEVCQAPDDSFAPVKIGDSQNTLLSIGTEYINKRIVSCFHFNSDNLAEAVNILSNNGTEAEIAINLEYTNGDEEATYAVHDMTTLLMVLGDLGYLGETFTKRAFVNFLGLTFKDSQDNQNHIRLPVWFQTKIGEEKLALPTEHADFMFVLIDPESNNRLAQIKYYMGLPDSTKPAQISYWRPKKLLEPSWAEARIDNGRSYSPGRLGEATNWFSASYKVMSGLQKFQARENLPFNGYGFNVCSDSVSLALAQYQILENPNTEEIKRSLDTFVISRATVEDLDTKLFDDIGLPVDFMNKNYPSDQELQEVNNEIFTARIKASFPQDSDRYTHFPLLKQTLDKTLYEVQ